jgi:hypothetical protein
MSADLPTTSATGLGQGHFRATHQENRTTQHKKPIKKPNKTTSQQQQQKTMQTTATNNLI